MLRLHENGSRGDSRPNGADVAVPRPRRPSAPARRRSSPASLGHVGHSAFSTQHSALPARARAVASARPPFSIQHSAFSIARATRGQWRAPGSHSAFSTQHSALPALCAATVDRPAIIQHSALPTLTRTAGSRATPKMSPARRHFSRGVVAVYPPFRGNRPPNNPIHPRAERITPCHTTLTHRYGTLHEPRTRHLRCKETKSLSINRTAKFESRRTSKGKRFGFPSH